MTRDSAVPSVCLITMGCAKNEVDSAAMMIMLVVLLYVYIFLMLK